MMLQHWHPGRKERTAQKTCDSTTDTERRCYTFSNQASSSKAGSAWNHRPWTLPLAPISNRDLTASSTIQLPGVPMWNRASQCSPFICCSVTEIFKYAPSEGAMDSDG